MDHQVFISYHHDSSVQLVEHIVQVLESHGIKCWYAPRDVESKYAGDIVRAIDSCKVFLLIINQYSSRSEHVLNEINHAFNRFHQKESIRLLPFRTDKQDLSDDAKYYLGRIHCLDGSEPPQEARIDALLSRISYWLENGEWESGAPDAASARTPSTGIRSSVLLHNANFVGRESLLAQMHQMLSGADNKLFLFGAGGLGKSELARQYLLTHQAAYQTVVWLTYDTDIEEMILSDQFLYIHGLESRNQDLTTPQAREAFYYRKLNYLKDHCGPETILVVDNFDSQDDRLVELMQGRYAMLFTSRISRSKDGYQELTVPPLDNTADQLALFCKFYKKPLSQTDTPVLLQLFTQIGFHTYAILLLAKQMQASRLTPAAMLDYFTGVSDAYQKRSELVMTHVMDVMTQIFNLSRLTAEQLSILQNMALLPVEGVETDLFFDLIELDDFMRIDELIDSSFIQYNDVCDVISLHPLMTDTIARNDPHFAAHCGVYVRNLTQRLSRFTHCKYQEKQVLLRLAQNYYLKWCDPALAHNVSFMERLAEAYAEYFMRDRSIAIMERLLTLPAEPVRQSWYHYYIANQRRCLGQYDLLSSEAAQSLAIIERVDDSPEKKQQLSLSYSMMGWARFHEDRLEESAQYFEQSLQLRREILPDDSVLLAWSYYNSATVLCKSGDLQKAAAYYEEAIRRFRRIDEIGICVPAYIGASETYLALGDLERADQALEEAFACEYAYYGEENCRKYWLYAVKAKLCAARGLSQEAETYDRLAKEEYEKYLQRQ